MFFDVLIVIIIVIGGILAVRRFSGDLRRPPIEDQLRAERSQSAATTPEISANQPPAGLHHD